MNNVIGSLSVADIKKIHLDYEKHTQDGLICENFGIVVVLDVLGWKQNVKPKDVNVYFQLINRLRSKFLDTCLRCADENEIPNVRISTLSDTIVILINGSAPYNELNVFNHLSQFLTESLEQGFMFRGSISRGKYYTNKLDNSFVGEVFYEAATYAESTEWAGVIINDTLSNALLENNSVESLIQLNIIPYPDIPFKDKIEPTKDSLVLLPYRDTWYDVSLKKSVQFDFIKKYVELMSVSENNNVKLKNTKNFYEFLYKSYWK